jgi:hypothetical protein
MTRSSLRYAVLAVVLLASPACAQTQPAPPAPPPADPTGPSATLFRDIDFNGPRVTVTSANHNLNLPWPVRSVRVERGSWELCTETNFHGGCRRYDASDRDIHSATEYTQSARPVPPADD